MKKLAKKKLAIKKKPARKPPARAKKPVNKLAAPKAPVFAKHVHPYGTARHADMAWHVAKLEERLTALDAKSAETIREALAFARERHADQMRFGTGGPYVIHPVRIANILLTEWAAEDPSALAAAMLHDVVEDTQTTIKEVKDRFGNDIGKLVDGMTMWKGSETFETYIKRVARGPEILRMLKCADTLDNLRSWHETDSEEFSRWWRNANELVLPMARSVDDDGRAAYALDRVLRDPWYLKRAGME